MIRKRPEPVAGQLPVMIEEQSFDQGDALQSEIESFLDCIRSNAKPVVTGEHGLAALETATRISAQVNAQVSAQRRVSA